MKEYVFKLHPTCDFEWNKIVVSDFFFFFKEDINIYLLLSLLMPSLHYNSLLGRQCWGFHRLVWWTSRLWFQIRVFLFLLLFLLFFFLYFFFLTKSKQETTITTTTKKHTQLRWCHSCCLNLYFPRGIMMQIRLFLSFHLAGVFTLQDFIWYFFEFMLFVCNSLS